MSRFYSIWHPTSAINNTQIYFDYGFKLDGDCSKWDTFLSALFAIKFSPMKVSNFTIYSANTLESSVVVSALLRFYLSTIMCYGNIGKTYCEHRYSWHVNSAWLVLLKNCLKYCITVPVWRVWLSKQSFDWNNKYLWERDLLVWWGLMLTVISSFVICLAWTLRDCLT